MSNLPYHDLRSFVELARQIDEFRVIEHADWNCEIGALSEVTAELIPEPPLLLFDRIKGYPAGYRIVSLLLGSFKRTALAWGLATDLPKMEFVRQAAHKVRDAKPIAPVEVPTGPVMDNVLTGGAVDLWKFPAPRYHARDGGRYIGTGDTVLQRDPLTGYINMATYRMQVHEKNLLGLWMSPGQHGRQICQRYWDQGKACPVVATFGQDPLTFMASHTKIPLGQSELDYLGGLRGGPLEVIRGPITGLPINAYAEIAIEGEIPPPSEEAREEGPFGEWPGYYAGGTIGTGERQPVIRVKAIYHRNDPIIMDAAPLWPGASPRAMPIEAGILWNQLESAGIQDIVGVSMFGENHYMWVVAIRQRYGGHARQTGLAVLGCAMAARHGRYVVIVDEDIDPTNLKEVLWAMQTRVDPASDIQIVDGTWSSPLDPRMSPDKRAAGDYTNSRAIFYAVRPYAWRDKFPPVSRAEPELREQIIEKYRSVMSFPRQ